MARNEIPTDPDGFFSLPPEDHKSYFDVLVNNCIIAYSLSFNDSIALDYNRVLDPKMRALILENKRYRAETRGIKAKRIIDGAKELRNLSNLAARIGEEVEEDSLVGVDTMRLKGVKRPNVKKKVVIDKDSLNLRLKTAQMQQEYLNLSTDKRENDESDALNIFFIPTTREEFEQLEVVEVNFGASDAASGFSDESDLTGPAGNSLYKQLQEISDIIERSEPNPTDGFYNISDGGAITEV